MVEDNQGLIHSLGTQSTAMDISSSAPPASFVFHSDVAASLADGHPVVALESAVITHGLPYPENVETALSMEAAVREGGATPATIAILQGEVRIGLTEEQLAHLGSRSDMTADPNFGVRKCSRRDIPIAVARGEDGATTVAGTMILAHLAGIEILATGGIGGVHRGHPFDVSADLTELGRTPVTVICSGVKSILDLRATREVLETNGVPIIGFGSDELPAFFSRQSGLKVDVRLDSPEEVADVIHVQRSLGLNTALLVSVPVPEAAAFDAGEAEAAIRLATREADEQDVAGPSATPWLLRRVAQLTSGRSLRSNVILLRNNGRVAGAVAAALSNTTNGMTGRWD